MFLEISTELYELIDKLNIKRPPPTFFNMIFKPILVKGI